MVRHNHRGSSRGDDNSSRLDGTADGAIWEESRSVIVTTDIERDNGNNNNNNNNNNNRNNNHRNINNSSNNDLFYHRNKVDRRHLDDHDLGEYVVNEHQEGHLRALRSSRGNSNPNSEHTFSNS